MYDEKEDLDHKRLYNLTGTFFEVIEDKEVDGVKFYGFQLIFSENKREMFTDSPEMFDKMKSLFHTYKDGSAEEKYEFLVLP